MEKNMIPLSTTPMEDYQGSDAYVSDTSLGCNDNPTWKKSSITIIQGDNTYIHIILAVVLSKIYHRKQHTYKQVLYVIGTRTKEVYCLPATQQEYNRRTCTLFLLYWTNKKTKDGQTSTTTKHHDNDFNQTLYTVSKE
jgi:hypothetical protein